MKSGSNLSFASTNLVRAEKPIIKNRRYYLILITKGLGIGFAIGTIVFGSLLLYLAR